MFDNKNIDAVSIATPNHWHVLATVWACQAGRDVYVEKRPATISGKDAARWRRPENTTVLCSVECRSFFAQLEKGGFNGPVAYEMCSPLRGGGSMENLDLYARKFLGFMRAKRDTRARQAVE